MIKDVKDFEGLYTISTSGEVFSKYSQKHLIPQITPKGYKRTILTKDGIRYGKFIHRLIAENFIPNPDNKPFVNHKNGDKLDNRIENLEWCTASENSQHAYDTGLQSKHLGEKNGKSILTEEDVRYIKSVYKSRDKKFGATPLAKKFGVSRPTISSIISGRTWGHIT